MKSNIDGSNETKFLWWILFGVIGLRILMLGAYPLMDTTESRYAEIAREMLTTHNWITPQLDPGSPFWAKPPLSFWLTALSFKIFGISEFTARFPSMLFAIGNMMFVFLLARNLRNRVFALKTCIILATTSLFYFMAGGVMTDPSLGFCVTMSMVSFLLAVEKDAGQNKRIWKYMFFVGLGLVLLAKGPVGVVLITMPIIVWTFVMKKWSIVRSSFPWGRGIILASIIAVPWHVVAELRTPGFLDYYFIGEHFKRFVVPGWKGDLYGSAHSQPKGMIWLFMIPMTLPWLIYLIANVQCMIRQGTLNKYIKHNDWVVYLLFWFLTPMVFFTLAGNILMTYVLPGLPAFAVLTMYAVECNTCDSVFRLNKWYVSSKTFFVMTLFVPIAFTGVSLFVLPRVGLRKSHKLIGQKFNKNIIGDARLIYTRKPPYSADFYSSGAVVPMNSEMDAKEMYQYVQDGQMDFYVIKKDDLTRVPKGFRQAVSQVGDFERYLVFQENNKNL